MARRVSNDTLIIAGALAFGLFSLAIPFAVLMFAPDGEFAQHVSAKTAKPEAPSTLVRNPRRADLKGERLAFNGNCSIGEFKDKRQIAATIEHQFGSYRLTRLKVTVTDMCIAELHGSVRNEREKQEAIRAAGHPWIRAIDIADLRISEPEPQR